MEEAAWGWRRLHNEDLHVYNSPDIITVKYIMENEMG